MRTTALEGWICVQPRVARAATSSASTTSSASIRDLGSIVTHGDSLAFSTSSDRHAEGWLVGSAHRSRVSSGGVAGAEVWVI